MKKEIIRLIETSGFDEAFENELGNWDTHKQAFDWLNALYIAHFGKERYANYESYRVARLVRLRKKLGQKRNTVTPV